MNRVQLFLVFILFQVVCTEDGMEGTFEKS